MLVLEIFFSRRKKRMSREQRSVRIEETVVTHHQSTPTINAFHFPENDVQLQYHDHLPDTSLASLGLESVEVETSLPNLELAMHGKVN